MSDELRKIFKENEQELWHFFTLSLDSDGKLKVHYDYTNWFNTDYIFNGQLVIWEYKYLGTELDNSKSKDLIAKYLDEYPNNVTWLNRAGYECSVDQIQRGKIIEKDRKRNRLLKNKYSMGVMSSLSTTCNERIENEVRA
ncbi:immunity protein YezG family protein [Bacillus sp. FSL R12-0074]|uniref:immunity protein YezG family protein n=1 Tax=Bacillus sp. FSL R12-0074 TaxID=2954664 RepID=UPI0030FC48E9